MSSSEASISQPCASIAVLEQPPRPPNSFFLFRSFMMKPENAALLVDEAYSTKAKDRSRQIGQIWRGLSATEKEEWTLLAQQKKAEHQARYPEYQYRPRRKAEIARAKEEKQREREAKQHERRVKSRKRVTSEPTARRRAQVSQRPVLGGAGPSTERRGSCEASSLPPITISASVATGEETWHSQTFNSSSLLSLDGHDHLALSPEPLSFLSTPSSRTSVMTPPSSTLPLTGPVQRPTTSQPYTPCYLPTPMFSSAFRSQASLLFAVEAGTELDTPLIPSMGSMYTPSCETAKYPDEEYLQYHYPFEDTSLPDHVYPSTALALNLLSTDVVLSQGMYPALYESAYDFLGYPNAPGHGHAYEASYLDQMSIAHVVETPYPSTNFPTVPEYDDVFR